MNLSLSINKPEAEEADGDVNETKDEIDDCWGGGGGGLVVNNGGG